MLSAIFGMVLTYKDQPHHKSAIKDCADRRTEGRTDIILLYKCITFNKFIYIEMCELSSINVTTIHGFAKKPDFKPGSGPWKENEVSGFVVFSQ